MTILAANIKIARKAKELTQRQLAERMGVDSMLVSKWERGWHKPSDENLQALAKHLGRDLAWFYTDHAALSRVTRRKRAVA